MSASVNGKTILLGVTGSIAAYKAAELASQLAQAGADVFVVMTANACQFVQPLTFQALTGHAVGVDQFDPVAWHGMEHISLAERADLVLIAPATANVIAHLAHGLADDLLTTTALATRAPVLIVPAMNTNMLEHPATQRNLERLRELGYHLVATESGRMACGTVGPGRLPTTEVILAHVERCLVRRRDFAGLRLLVTAGPTREAIDPVRYISNHSTGRMGFALAERAVARGATLTLVTGPTCLTPPRGANVIAVETAQQMVAAAMDAFDDCDVVISAAALADYRPKKAAAQKLKKQGRASICVELEGTPDLLTCLAARRQRQLLVGFAAETNDVEKHAREKLKRKRLDLIVANDVTQPGAGFGVDTNIVTLITEDQSESLPLMSKHGVADRVLDTVLTMRAKMKST